LRKLRLHLFAFFFQNVDAQIERRALQQAFGQRPKLAAQLRLERLRDPLGQVVTMRLEQIGQLHGVAGFEPAFFLHAQGAVEKIARAMKAQNRQAPLLGPRARAREVFEQQLFTQHGIDGLGQRRAFARAQVAVLAKKARHHGVGRVLEAQRAAHEIGASVQ